MFTKLRPLYNDVAEAVPGTGLFPITNEACPYFATKADADALLPLMIDAAKKAQLVNPALGIVPPSPDLSLSFGKQGNDYRDLLNGATEIVYFTAGGPRAYCVRGSVVIPNFEAPNATPKAIARVDAYIGKVIEGYAPGKHLVFNVAGDGDTIGTFAWV